jgi:hypothetical protein
MLNLTIRQPLCALNDKRLGEGGTQTFVVNNNTRNLSELQDPISLELSHISGNLGN